MIKKFHLYIVIGIIAIAFSIKCFTFNCDGLSKLSKEDKELYNDLKRSSRALERDLDRMDGYNPTLNKLTLIRNEIEDYNEKVEKTISVIGFGFGSILLMSGLGFLAIGIITPIEEKKNKEK